MDRVRSVTPVFGVGGSSVLRPGGYGLDVLLVSFEVCVCM